MVTLRSRGGCANPNPAVLAVPFQQAEEAWFWTMASLAARREGARAPGSAQPRPCDPDDVVKCLERLYQRGQVGGQHLRILQFWGERQIAPSSRHAIEAEHARLWQEALEQLTWPLRLKGIVA